MSNTEEGEEERATRMRTMHTQKKTKKKTLTVMHLYNACVYTQQAYVPNTQW